MSAERQARDLCAALYPGCHLRMTSGGGYAVVRMRGAAPASHTSYAVADTRDGAWRHAVEALVRDARGVPR